MNGVAYQWNIIPQDAWYLNGYKLSESNQYNLQYLTYTGVSPEVVVQHFCRLVWGYNFIYSLDAGESVAYFKALSFDEFSDGITVGISDITSLLEKSGEVDFAQEVINNTKLQQLNTKYAADRCVALALSIKNLHQVSTNSIT
ncbi:hypothetical protein [Thalassotalea profundi]|uniref:Uncharacterized protein n=1 Tax=Thalassotalea profundi TaxID=2036687 RepID=A0ABQ3J1V9_9GAMM|nr:hypothetical protein [Thalassotalea profundi]GHE96770.1 hypothetical protein GCM10011501_27840 [Thalassotalea profundi]